MLSKCILTIHRTLEMLDISQISGINKVNNSLRGIDNLDVSNKIEIEQSKQKSQFTAPYQTLISSI